MKKFKIISMVMCIWSLIVVLSCQKEKLPEPSAENFISKSDSLKKISLTLDTTKQIIDFSNEDTIATKSGSLIVDYLKTFSSKAGDSDYFILKSNTTWKISSYPTWLTVSPLSGTGNANITVIVKENSGVQRSGQIIITGKNTKQNASITALQLGAATENTAGSLSVDYLKTFSAVAGDNDYFIINANTSWKIASAPSWVTISPLSGTGKANITVTVQANTGAQRTGVISISGNGVTQNASLNVIQVAGASTSIGFIPNDIINVYPFTSLGSTITNKRLYIDASMNITPLHFQNENVSIQSCLIESDFSGNHDLLTIEGATSSKSVKMSYNNITFKNPNPHTLVVGTEGSTSSDNNYDGAEIIGNKLTGLGDLTSGMNHAIFVGFNKNATIKYNFLTNCVDGIVLKGNSYDNSKGIVSYNLIKNDSYYSTILSGIRNTKIFNNTYYSDNSVVSYAAFINFGNGSSNTNIKNNIFYSSGKQWIMISFEDAASLEGLQCDYNIYYRSGSNHDISFFVHDSNGDHYYSFSQWQGLGFDKHSKVIDPMLDPNSLIPNSAIYGGTDLGAEFNTGLDSSNIWDRSGILTKIQSSTWQVGAFIK